MKKIKGTFNYYFSHTHRGSHRTSNGFKYHYYDTRGVKGPFFDHIVPLSYQDLIKLRNFASEVNSKHYYCEEDYEWAESYTSNESSDSNEDFGLCQFFNENYSRQYDIILVSGTLNECTIHIDEMPPLKCFNIAYNNALADQELKRKEIQSEINQLKQRLLELENNLKTNDSSKTLQDRLLKELYAPLKENMNLFELNKPFYDKLYPLDIAIFNNDESLLNALIVNGAFQYSSEFDPILSAKCGNFNKVLNMVEDRELSQKDVLDLLSLIMSLPESEFHSLFESKTDLIRDGRVLLFYHDKLKIYALVKSYYNKRGYQSPFDRAMEPIKVALENSLKVKDFCKANYIYDFSQCHRFHTGFYDEDMLLLSFEYGNIEFINRWDLWSLVNDITDRFRYSYAFNRLEFDSRGDVLRLKWNFEPYVKPENIGKELYDKIIDQIENHSQNYTCY